MISDAPNILERKTHLEVTEVRCCCVQEADSCKLDCWIQAHILEAAETRDQWAPALSVIELVAMLQKESDPQTWSESGRK